MLTEPKIVALIVNNLRAKGYSNIRSVPTSSHGDDIVATSPDGCYKLHIEVKGQTSARHGSKRYGKPFTSAQCRDHVATAVYKALSMKDKSTSTCPRRIAIALPDIKSNRNFYKAVKKSLNQLKVGIIWVDPKNKPLSIKASWTL